ncbi:hypothetical protein Tco_1254809 [Tanacetum coccineum]
MSGYTTKSYDNGGLWCTWLIYDGIDVLEVYGFVFRSCCTMLVPDAFFYLQTQLEILMGSDDRLLYAFITPGKYSSFKIKYTPEHLMLLGSEYKGIRLMLPRLNAASSCVSAAKDNLILLMKFVLSMVVTAARLKAISTARFRALGIAFSL